MRITIDDEKHGYYSFATDLTYQEALNALRDKATYLKMPLEKYPTVKEEKNVDLLEDMRHCKHCAGHRISPKG